MAVFQNDLVLTAVPLRWRDELDATVVMYVVVPVYKRMHPLTGLMNVGEGLAGIGRAVFQGPKQ